MEEERPGGVHPWRAPVVKHAEKLEQDVERQDPLHHWPHQHGGNPNDFDEVGENPPSSRAIYRSGLELQGSQIVSRRIALGKLNDVRHLFLLVFVAASILSESLL